MKNISWWKLFWLYMIVLFTIEIIVVTFYSLSSGILDIFPYLYIIPIILLARLHPRIAIYFTIVLGWIYLGLVYFFGPHDIRLFASSVAWFYIFVTLGVVISSMADSLKQEKMFRDIFENSQAGIFTFDLGTTQIREINKKAAGMLGYEEAELRKAPISTFWLDSGEREQFLSSLGTEHQITDIELLFSRKDHTTIWALVNSSIGTDNIVICSAVDITERKRIKDIINESEIRYRTLFDSASDAIFIHDFDGRIFEANRIACDRLGYSRSEITAMNLKDLDAGAFALMTQEQYGKIQDGDGIIFETVHQSKEGRRIPIEVSSRIIQYSAGTAIISIVRDISERKKAESALRESEKRYRMVGELIPFGVWMCNAEGNFTYLSESFLNLLNLTLADCANFSWVQRLPMEDRDRTLSDWKQCVQTSCFWDYEYRIIDREGKEHFVLSRGSPLYDQSGNVISWVGIHLDITERRRYENRLESSLREKEVIIKEVHHRVKNNMQVISGFLLLQSNYIDDPLAVEKLNECQRRIKTMALVHEKLYQSKSLEFINTADYIQSLVSDLMESYTISTEIDLKMNIEQVNINLDTAIPCGLIINELVTNALKYAFKDRPTGKIILDLHLGADHRFTLIVQDNGVGLPSDYEARSAASLGMQLVKVLIRQLGGEMNISNEKGARFEISFPEKF
ncbi:MAG: PAS domain S-box protein [Methanoregula sp.]|nr:PAS domain S-box protein [Methanoregula sp.]